MPALIRKWHLTTPPGAGRSPGCDCDVSLFDTAVSALIKNFDAAVALAKTATLALN